MHYGNAVVEFEHSASSHRIYDLCSSIVQARRDRFDLHDQRTQSTLHHGHHRVATRSLSKGRDCNAAMVKTLTKKVLAHLTQADVATENLQIAVAVTHRSEFLGCTPRAMMTGRLPRRMPNIRLPYIRLGTSRIIPPFRLRSCV